MAALRCSVDRARRGSRQRPRRRLLAVRRVSGGCFDAAAGPCAASCSRYQMPAPNTIDVDDANTISEVSTLPASSVGADRIGGAQQAVDDVGLAPDLGRVPAGEHCDEARRRHPRPARAAASCDVEQACRAATPTATTSDQQQHRHAEADHHAEARRTPASTGGRSLGAAPPSAAGSRRRACASGSGCPASARATS